MPRLFQAMLLLSVMASGVAACDRSGNPASAQMMAGHRGQMMRGGMKGPSARHQQVMTNGIPAAYASLRNPLADTRATLASGAQLYQQNCAICHGASGNGDGPAAKQITPRPANLRLTAQMPMSRSDSFLYWTIAEGGQPFGTAMPPFKDTLSKDQIWALVSYVQSGLPAKK